MSRASRNEILAALKRSPGSSAAEIAAVLGISRSSARDKLHDLTVEGAVNRIARAEGEGRPTHRFFVTEEADALLPNVYDELATRLADAVAAKDPDLWADFATRFMSDLVGAGNGEQERRGEALNSVSANLDRAGALTALVDVTDAVQKLEIHHCPLRQLACERQELCEAELAALRRGLRGSTVTRTEHVAAGDDFCVYTIRHPG